MRIQLGRLKIIAPLVFVACAAGPTYTPPDEYELPADRIYDASFDDVWYAVLETVTDMEIPIDNMEKASGFLRSDVMSFPSGYGQFLDCGNAKTEIPVYSDAGRGVTTEWRPVAEDPTFRTEARLTVLVRDSDDQRSIRLRMGKITGHTTDAKGIVRYWDCVSTGKIEEMFFSTIEQRLPSD